MFGKRAGKARALTGVTVVTAATAGLVAVGALSARADEIGPRVGCATTESQCSYSSGWWTVSNNCQAQVTYTLYRSDDVMDIAVEVKNSNAFVACHAYGTPLLETTGGKDDTGSKSYGFACGTWDPTCSHDQTRSYEVSNAVPSSDVASIDQVWAKLTTS